MFTVCRFQMQNDLKSVPVRRLMDLINKYPDKDWNWVHLSGNPGIDLGDVESNPDKPWYRSGLRTNRNIVFKHDDSSTFWIRIKSMFGFHTEIMKADQQRFYYSYKPRLDK